MNAYATAALNGELQKLDTPIAGRNNQLFVVAARLYSLAAAGVLDTAEVESALVERGGAMGLARHEVVATLRSAEKRGNAAPAELSPAVRAAFLGERRQAERDAMTERAIGAPEACQPPSAAWQSPARAFVDWAADTLWSGAHDDVLDYLVSRGMNELTIANAGLGYHPRRRETSRAKWGLPPHPDYGDSLWLHQGIVLPWQIGDELWKVQIRRDDTNDPAKRYATLPGSSNALYAADRLRPGRPAVLVEGVFDALVLRQAAADLGTPVAAGTSGARRARWYAQLALCSRVLLAFDAEAAGDAAAAKWAAILGDTAQRWLPYGAKDPAAMAAAGLDLRQWMDAGLEAAS